LLNKISLFKSIYDVVLEKRYDPTEKHILEKLIGMKIKLTMLLLLFTMLSATCKKEKHDKETLPAASQIGKDTFGCLIDGKIFVPRKSGIGDFLILNASYDYLNGGYYFSLIAPRSKDGIRSALYLKINDLVLKEGQVYKLASTDVPKSANGVFVISTSDFLQKKYKTTSSLGGEMLITKFEKHIVSGTFWFDAISEDGVKIEVREGRFDIPI